MAAVTKLKASHLETVSDGYFELFNAATEKQQLERDAVVKIQSTWRGFVVRRNLLQIMLATGTAQKHYRGHLGRKRWAVKQREVAVTERQHYFDLAAVEIQRHWRAYWSRKRIHSFAARKAYIHNVLETSERLRAQMAEAYEQQKTSSQVKVIEDAHKAFQASIAGKHHLLSTETCDGIYNSPFAAVSGGLPRVAGIPMEQHLAETLDGKLDIPEKGKAPKEKPPLEPLGNLSIQAESRFDAVEEAKRQQDVHHKIASIGETPFITTVKSEKPAYQSINIGTPYSPPIKDGGRSLKTGKPPTDKPFFTRVHNKELFDDYQHKSQKLPS